MYDASAFKEAPPGLVQIALHVVVIAAVFMMAEACARSTPEAPGERAGMSIERLGRITSMLDSAVEARNIGSAVALIARDGEIVYLEAAGEAAPGVPMFDDAIMRLASVGKAFTAVAAMILYERGVLDLDEPVSNFIPEFAEAQVAVADGDETTLVDPARPVTVRHLLTHTGGLAVASDAFEEAWQATEASTTTTDLAQRIARIPMPAHPGEGFEYGYYGSHYEVLAAVIEEASGQTFETFLNENVFGPLGMNDSYFWVPEAKQDRLAAIYKLRGEPLSIDRARGDETNRTTFFSGGGGIRSTVHDVFRFGQMILDGGVLDGVRILSPKTIDLMATDHVGDLMTWGGGEYGWGFGFAVRRRVRDYGIGTVGTLGWTGGSGAQWWVDRQEGIVAVLVTPFAPPPYWPVHNAFERLMYAAIAESRASSE